MTAAALHQPGFGGASSVALHQPGFGGASPDRLSTILAVLRAEEEARGVRILYAAESGSRAWGFASPDSDWDVRVVYVHPLDWYLRIEDKPRDTFESMHPGDIDLSAWELRKALRLFAKSNVPLLEWLGSPLVYLDRDGFGDRLRALIPKFFDPRGAAWHHLSMQRSALEDLAPDGTIRIKKLCYALRSALSVHWIAARASMPPVPFPELFAASHLDSVARAAIDDILAAKRDASERGRIVLPPALATLFAENERLVPAVRFPKRERGELEALDEILKSILEQERESYPPRIQTSPCCRALRERPERPQDDRVGAVRWEPGRGPWFRARRSRRLHPAPRRRRRSPSAQLPDGTCRQPYRSPGDQSGTVKPFQV